MARDGLDRGQGWTDGGTRKSWNTENWCSLPPHPAPPHPDGAGREIGADAGSKKPNTLSKGKARSNIPALRCASYTCSSEQHKNWNCHLAQVRVFLLMLVALPSLPPKKDVSRGLYLCCCYLLHFDLASNFYIWTVEPEMSLVKRSVRILGQLLMWLGREILGIKQNRIKWNPSNQMLELMQLNF